MDLSTFITASLLQIAEGVKDAQDRARAAGGYINPAANMGKTNDAYFGSMVSGAPVFLVDFDVAVMATEAADIEGGAKLQVAGIFSVGGSGASTTRSETTSRIHFKVPMALPEDPVARVAHTTNQEALHKFTGPPSG